AYSSERMVGAIRLLLERAVRAGKVRDDVQPEDLFRTLIGIFYSQGPGDWQPTALRMVDIFVDGLQKR
ncbi:MAG: TetR/AcrR family transcriptional regulator, partial [Rhizobiaceae bacterium]|nr:TetR/AcrR family transcriptional regulator [Rhizobiaceae bacterium]